MGRAGLLAHGAACISLRLYNWPGEVQWHEGEEALFKTIVAAWGSPSEKSGLGLRCLDTDRTTWMGNESGSPVHCLEKEG